uniref:Uncharacterized protein n=2 Tax=Lotharella globosa TaxID=91324 RepID=A0A7S3Z2D2_9EUKA|mmetsp:Transcript_20288/g.40915  ORF Transcript_20288/g.40915 Transcript_20288/m.40915 type:complete len:432 (+) Transcript_20288:68-1363(+)
MMWVWDLFLCVLLAESAGGVWEGGKAGVAQETSLSNKTGDLIPAVKNGQKLQGENATSMMEVKTEVKRAAGKKGKHPRKGWMKQEYYPTYHDGLRREEEHNYEDLARSYDAQHQAYIPQYRSLDYIPSERADPARQFPYEAGRYEGAEYNERYAPEKYAREYPEYGKSMRLYPTSQYRGSGGDPLDQPRGYQTYTEDLERKAADARLRSDREEQQLALQMEQLRAATARIRKAEGREAQALEEVRQLSSQMRAIGQDNEDLNRRLDELSRALKSEEDELAETRTELQNAEAAVKDAEARATLAESRAADAEERLRMFKEQVQRDADAAVEDNTDQATEGSVDDKDQAVEEKEQVEEGEKVSGQVIDDEESAAETEQKLDPDTQKEVDQAEEDAQIISVSIIIILAIAGTSCGVGTVASVAYMYRKNQKLLA